MSKNINTREVLGKVKNLEAWAQQVWMLKSLEDKKAIALDMVDNFDFKRKAQYFIVKINAMTCCNKIDMFVSDIALAGNGLGTK